TARPRALDVLRESVDVLIVATKASGMEPALERIEVEPAMVLPLLNGLDHLQELRRRFGHDGVVAGAIRVEADRPEPAVIVHTSPFLLVDMAFGEPSGGARDGSGDSARAARSRQMHALAQRLERAG